MNFISLGFLFVIMVWLMNDTPNNVIADTAVSASVEQIIKYTVHKFSLLVSAVNIQALWLMDEQVRIFHMEVWFNPPIDPTIVDIRMILNVKVQGYNK